MASLSVGRETAGRAGRCRSRLKGRERPDTAVAGGRTRSDLEAAQVETFLNH
jgi:hypothetical protein